MPTVHMLPSPTEYTDKKRKAKSSSGIQRVVEELGRRLPEYDWQFVDTPYQADLRVTHACSRVGSEVAHCHGLYPTAELTQVPAWMWEMNKRVISAVRHARLFSVPSPWVAEIFQRDMGLCPVVLEHGIDVSGYQCPPKEISKKLTVIWNKNRPGDVCSPEPVNRLAELRPDVNFVSTFGKPGDNLRVTGTVPHGEMIELMKRCDIYLATTRETFGIGILEALALGLPVVAWNWGHVPNLIEHEVSGVTVEPLDYNATSEALSYCVENFARMSEAARERANQHPWEPIIKKYDKMYKKVLETRVGPKVSVIIPCFNYERYVGRAIESVKRQTHQDLECVIIDDGSTDGSLEIARKAARGDSRITVITQSNAGVAAARNEGAVLARGEYIAFLDADDELDPRFIELLLPSLEQDKSLGLVFGRIAIKEGDARAFIGSWPSSFNFGQQLRGKNQVPATNLMRRDCFLRTGGFRQRNAPSEDAELWARMGLMGIKMEMVTDAVTYMYRMHQSSASSEVRLRERDEPDWLAWLPGGNGGPSPCASIAKPRLESSHPVRNYDKPAVSVIIPVGDRHEDNLLDAIDSVQAQTYPGWELIVVDDTSDGELEHCGRIPYATAFPFVRWLRCGARNPSTARNMGAEIARGWQLCFLDADDILYKNFLGATLPFASDCMIYTDWVELPGNKTHRSKEFALSRLLHQSLFSVTFLHPKAAWEAVGGFDESLEGWEDWDYTIALGMKGFCGLHVRGAHLGYNYQTGKRREESLGLQQQLFKKIRAKWKGVEPVPCRGCGGRRARVSARRAPTEDNPTSRGRQVSDELVEIEYTGASRGARLYKNPATGNRYRFGGGRHKRKLIRKEDAPFFLRMKSFRAQEARREPKPKPEPTSNAPQPQQIITVSAEPAEPAEPTEPAEPLVIPGVQPFLLRRLERFGWDLDKLHDAEVSDLIPIPGVGRITAGRILERVHGGSGDGGWGRGIKPEKGTPTRVHGASG